MTTKTLTWVSDVSDTPDTHGNLYINVSFDDDTVAFKGGKPDTIGEHHAALLALVGKPSEFMLEDTGKKTGKGKDKFKLVGYPGWEASSAGGGGGGGGKSWYNSEEGVRFTQERTDRRTALMQAVEMVTTGKGVVTSSSPSAMVVESHIDWKKTADVLYNWLRQDVAPSTAPADEQGHTNPVGAPEPGSSPATPGSETSEAEGHVVAKKQSTRTADSSGEGRDDPKPPTTSHRTPAPSADPRWKELWGNLYSYAEASETGTVSLVNRANRSNWTVGNKDFIPIEALERTVARFNVVEA